jgi:hypothetical protein
MVKVLQVIDIFISKTVFFGSFIVIIGITISELHNWSSIVYITPFAVYIIYKSYKNKIIVPVLLFVLTIILINLFVDKGKQEWLYPIINDGKIIITEDSYMVIAEDVRYGRSNTFVHDLHYTLYSEEKLIKHFAKKEISDFISTPESKEVEFLSPDKKYKHIISKMKKNEIINISNVDIYKTWDWWFFGPLPKDTFKFSTDKGLFKIDYDFRVKDTEKPKGIYTPNFTFNKDLKSDWIKYSNLVLLFCLNILLFVWFYILIITALKMILKPILKIINQFRNN